eukprot:6173836-Pleurochrysis_carterae.AAC.3
MFGAKQEIVLSLEKREEPGALPRSFGHRHWATNCVEACGLAQVLAELRVLRGADRDEWHLCQHGDKGEGRVERAQGQRDDELVEDRGESEGDEPASRLGELEPQTREIDVARDPVVHLLAATGCGCAWRLWAAALGWEWAAGMGCGISVRKVRACVRIRACPHARACMHL